MGGVDMGACDLQVIISPAKKMLTATEAGERVDFAPRDIPPFPEASARVLAALRSLAPDELRALWKVRDRLFAENVARMGSFELVPSWEDARKPPLAGLMAPAIFSYVGIQYQSMAPEVLDAPALEWLQGHLWVLSALYGCARPFDAVMPYRLEMGARLSVGGARDLYAFWGPLLGALVGGGAKGAGGVADGGEVVGAGEAVGASGVAGAPAPICVVNLASVEYSRAVLPWLPAGTPVVTCLFGEALKDGRPVQRSTASKTARGSMVRWLAERRPDDPAELCAFDVGYRFAPEPSDAPSLSGEVAGTLVFMRA